MTTYKEKFNKKYGFIKDESHLTMKDKYKILQRTKDIANEYGLTVNPAKNPKYKIDVYNDNELIESIGATGYLDYPHYLLLEEQENVSRGYAKIRKKLYLHRHKNDNNLKGVLAKLLLWS
jgi:hypothetical protein